MSDLADLTPVYAAFQQQARLRPDALAVVSEQDGLSYGVLESRVGCLAEHLRAAGVGPDVLVGLFAERSPEALVGMLAVLKTGGAYVPIDVDAPPRRNAELLKTCRLRIVLSRASHAGRLPKGSFDVVELESCRSDASTISELAYVDITEALAYVLFTSGTTGRPKGVMISRGSLANYVAAVADEYRIGPADRVLQFAPLTFDNSAEEIFMTLCRGATLVLRPNGVLDSPNRFFTKCQQWGITILDLPTAYWHTLAFALESGSVTVPTTVRLVIVGGEKARWDALNHWRAACGGRVRLLNTYGPTETTIGVTISDQTEPEPTADAEHHVPIGRAIRGIRAYVVNENLECVGPGIPGELAIGGAGVARGYLGQPELTAKFFKADPFTDVKGARLYLTGDRVRCREDGQLEFLGRVDSQVKIRGVRVEPGEVEAVLQCCPAVQEVAVSAQQQRATGANQLIAYVVWRADRPNTFDAGALRSWLRDRLPAAMIPSTFVVLDALPRTSAGKLDVRSLPAPPSRSSREHGSPRTDSERIVAGVWRRLLGLQNVGRTDDFFDLGGDSLLLVHLQLELERLFGLDAAASDLACRPTVAGQALLLDDRVAESHGARADVMADASLDPEIRPRGKSVHPDDSDSVLLTGGTGFIGSHVLAELLLRTSATIVCLVHDADSTSARGRLEQQLRRIGLWQPNVFSRVVALAADVRERYLGLGTAEFRKLAGKVRVIYHCAAEVNLLCPYERLRPVNVTGVEQILRLATIDRPVPLHHVSTLDVLDVGWQSHAGVAFEAPAAPVCNGLGGYAVSKWVAERLIQDAAGRGLPVSVYRPGWVTGHSKTGFTKTNDLPARLIRGIVGLGSLPQLADFELRPTPVDFVSWAIVALSLRGAPDQSGCRYYHLVNPRSVTLELVTKWARDLGYHVETIPAKTWWSSLSATAGTGDGDAAMLRGLLWQRSGDPNVGRNGRHRPMEYSLTKTSEALAALGIECPPPTRTLLSTYLRFLARSGSLAAGCDPHGRAGSALTTMTRAPPSTY